MTSVLPAPVARDAGRTERPSVRGPFLWRGDEKLWLRGVTYGTFGPNAAGESFPEPSVAAGDLAAMRDAGINTVRTYVPAPKWFLDEADRNGLLVLCGLPWEQHVAFLEDPDRPADIERRVREQARSLAGHPALLGYAVGNEIPGDVVRWQGRRRVERFLARLAKAVRDEDPGALVTYVNFPTTEYLRLPFVDFVSFNVYLEDRERLEAYLARLQNLADGKPLVMAEIGLDSRRNGLDAQASALAWQVEATFAAGCVGCYVFAWTDEWYRGGLEIDDWDFGLVDRERRPKPALAAVREAFEEAPFSSDGAWPRVSVAICSYNGAATIRDALEGATRLDYPDYEVIVVDDGSTDATAEIASEFDVRLIRTENRGLSAARNAAWQAATGEIVAYTDDDARPDPHWLGYLMHGFAREGAAGVGGPNLAPRGDGLVASCVANAPGGPTHVLIDDVTAEHIPGCNMSFRRDVLEEVGGFDTRFRTAGDDVDLCWRVQDAGHRITFHPTALVWHHRRNEVATYWKQQQGYGKAEALLEAKWPHRYNPLGHLYWSGRIYGPGLIQAVRLLPERVYHGTWGRAPFQKLYRPAHGTLDLPTMPEWYLLAVPLVLLGSLGLSWQPLLWSWAALAVVLAFPVVHAFLGAARADYADPVESLALRARRRLLTGWLHLIQPLARLKGRLEHGLTPWRRRDAQWTLTWPRRSEIWSESWRSTEAWLEGLEVAIAERGIPVRRGGDYDRWDLESVGGLFGSVRTVLMVEEHGQGKQNARIRTTARFSPLVSTTVGVLAVLAALAAADGAGVAAGTLVALGVVALTATARDVGVARVAIAQAIERVEAKVAE